jgi:hypothetical protein
VGKLSAATPLKHDPALALAAEAIEMAKKLVIDRDVELWQLDRKIGTFSFKQK